MGFFKKLLKGDWSNPFDNVKSGVKNITENSWNKGLPILKGMAGVGGAMYLGGISGMAWSDILKTFGPAALDFLSAERANATSAQSAKDRMEWEALMSNSAYQRAMADMMKAGLNPMLAYSQGGASTPPGAQFNAQSARPGSVLNESMMGQAQRTLLAEQVLNTKADKELKEVTAGKTKEEALRIKQETSNLMKQALVIEEQKNELVQRIEQSKATTALSMAEKAKVEKEVDLLSAKITNAIQEYNNLLEQAEMYRQKGNLDKAHAADANARNKRNKLIASWMEELYDANDRLAKKAGEWLGNSAKDIRAKARKNREKRPGRIEPHQLIKLGAGSNERYISGAVGEMQ